VVSISRDATVVRLFSPLATWSILRALQKINKTKRLEGEAVMSATPFFQSAGRGDLQFWGEDDGPTVVVWEDLSESEQEQWSKKMGMQTQSRREDG